MNIVLIDDHELMLETLKHSISFSKPEWNIDTCNSVEAYISKYNSNSNIDIIVSDIMMPATSGIRFLEDYRSKIPSKVKFLILSSMTDVQTIKNAVRNGASGYLSKSISISELLTAFETVINDEVYIENSLKKRMINSMFAEDQIVYHLTDRERIVLKEICNGKTIKEIAYDLSLSSHTVQYYHRNVMKKLKVNRTPDLILLAIKLGLYNPEVDKHNI